MASSSEKVSFTIRRPTPPEPRGMSPAEPPACGPNFKIPALPRHLAVGVSNESTPLGSPLSQSEASSPQPDSTHDHDSSDEEDEELQDQLVTGFDRFGVQRCVTLNYRSRSLDNSQKASIANLIPSADGRSRKPKKEEPLVISALKNKDWRALARKRRGLQYVPESGRAGTGADGTVGGLGIRETINTGPQVSGLQLWKREQVVKVEEEDGDVVMEEAVKEEVVEETEEQRALRALLAEANGELQSGPTIDAIPTPVSEADALKQDIDELPESASLQDYERVPISQFGAAMLRGMGWKEGQAASRKPGKGMVEPYLPTARPALLGIGAKEQEALDDGSKRKPRKAPMKYIPVAKMERSDSNRERSRSPVRSSNGSRRSSRSPSRRDRDERSSRDDSSRRRDRDHNRDRDYERSSRDTGRDRERDGNRERERVSERDWDRDHRRDYDREKDRRRGYGRELSDKPNRRSEISKESSRKREY